MVLQKELLYALLGHTGEIILDTPDGFALANGLPLVDASERALLSRLLALGHCYRELEAFVDAQLFGDAPTGTAPTASPYFLALANGLEECLQPYRARVLQLEQTLLRTPELSLPSMQLGMGDFELTLPALRRLLAGVQHANLRGVALLDHLHAAAAGCVHSLRAHLAILLRHTQRVLRSQLAAWLLHGELLPGDGDFFIEYRPPPTPAAADAADESKGDVAHEPSASAGASSMAASVGGEGGGSDEDVLRGGWFTFDVAVARKPAFLPMRVAERVLFIGKAVRVLRASEQRQESYPHTSSLMGGGDAALTTLLPLDEDDPIHARQRVLALDAGASPRYLAARAALSTRPHAPSPGAPGTPGTPSAPHHPPSRHAERDALRRAAVGAGVTGARHALVDAERAVEAAELTQEHSAVKELEAEGIARSLLSSLTMSTPAPPKGGAGARADEERMGPARDAMDGGFAPCAATQMRGALHGFGDDLRGLPMSDGSLQLAPLERLLGQMHRTASRLLWRHLSRECGLLDLLDAVKSYLLLGRTLPPKAPPRFTQSGVAFCHCAADQSPASFHPRRRRLPLRL